MRRFLIWLVIAGLVAGLVYRAIQHQRGRTVRSLTQIQWEEGFPVEVAEVVQRPFRVVKDYLGTLVAGEEAEIVPLVGEYVSQVVVKEGDRVKAGDAICLLSKDNPQAGYQQARLALENAERELARLEALFFKGAVSRQAVDGATLHRDLAKRQLEVAERLLTLKSPIEGVVSELRAEVGKFAPPGIPIAKVVDDRRLRVKFEIPAGDGELIAKGQPCWVRLDDESVEGRIVRMALSADKEGRTFEAWAELSTRPMLSVWRSGVMVEVKVLAINEDRALLIPPEALVRETGSPAVWVVNGGKAEKVRVTVRGINADAIWIGEGLSPGDPVVVSGKENLFPNAPVKIIRISDDLSSVQ